LLFSLLHGCSNIKTKQEPKDGDINKERTAIKATEIKIDYAAEGKTIATETQAVLAKKLIAALKAGGPEYALQFCNLQAYPLTDSMAKIFNSSIKRVTDKTRNPGNQANEIELAYIEKLKTQMAKGEMPGSKMEELNGKMVGYYPIVTNKMCMQCHGKKEVDIMPATLKKLHQLYPADKATGYGENELRGLWVVEMNKK
jgi:Protein of unknown function (DUF3365)